MKVKKVIHGFMKYISEMNQICVRALLLILLVGSTAMLGVAAMIITYRTKGISIIEAEIVPIILYIFRSICLAEFFLLLIDYAARRA